MRTFVILVVSIFTAAAMTAFAKAGHGAHSHGHGRLAIAFDNALGTIELTAPGDSVYGFEHEAKKKADKAKVEKAFDTSRNVSATSPSSMPR